MTKKREWKHSNIYIGGGVNFEFLSYCWAFYNPIDGTYPIEGLTLDAMAKACANVEANGGPHFEWSGGDTDDRCGACEVLLQQNPDLKNPYDK
jgi:hypothetical protein